MPNGDANAPQYVTPDQLKALESRISETAKSGADSAIREFDKSIATKVKEGVTAALTGQQVSVAVEAGTRESNTLKILLASIPALATLVAIIMGFGVWLKQKDIEKTINEQDRNLTTRLAITQEFYKRKFDIYEKAHQQMTLLLAALQNKRVDPNALTQAFDSLSSLDTYSKTNQIYMTADVAAGLSDVWGAASDWLQDGGSIEGVVVKIQGAERKMKEELDAENITKLTPCATPPPNNVNGNNAQGNRNGL
ncbi:MAG: hypothetical protein JOZ96_14910 [Acidobacteria bacterium]|nr:hypothetical protein [Acidobacteriota bacterium]